MKSLRTPRPFPSLMLLALPIAALGTAARADAPAGTFVTQGQKGAITLTLSRANEDGEISGTLRGGTLNAKLEGDVENDVAEGIAIGEDGALLSGFRVRREGATVVFEIVELSAEGTGPVKSRIVFAAGAGAAAPGTPVKPAPPRQPVEEEGEADEPGEAMGGATEADEGEDVGMDEEEMPVRQPRTRQPATGAKPAWTAPHTAPRPAPKAVVKPAAARPAAKPAPKAAPRLAEARPVAAAAPRGGPGSGGNWKIHRHAIGVSVRYPATWKAKTVEGALQLIPPNPLMVGGQAREIYLMFADGAEGVATAQDPRIPQFLDGKINGFAPFLQRSGEPKAVRAGTLPGIQMTWDGTNPQGMQVRAHVFAVIMKGYGIGLLALGDAKRIAAREEILRSVFASLAASSESRDPQVVGAWKFWSYKSSADGKYGTETSRRFVLSPDGRCSWNSKGESSGNFSGRDAGGNTTWTGGVAGSSTNGDNGRWTAANGALYVLWDDGSTSTWSYRVGMAGNGKRLFLTGSNGKADEWVAN